MAKLVAMSFARNSSPKPRFDYAAAVRAGVIAGAVFMILQMLLVPLLLGGSPWQFPAMAAAIVLGPERLAALGFGLGPLLIAMGVHFGLAMAFAAVLGAIVRRLSASGAALVGVTFGAALYVLNFHGMTALFPWFANARDGVSLLAHAAFGALAGYAYVALGSTREQGVAFGARTRAPVI